MIGSGMVHALLAPEKRTPLLQMTPDELVRTYVSHIAPLCSCERGQPRVPRRWHRELVGGPLQS